jgi:glycosyltransferase involved in cell wall biosynthesis
MSVQWAIGEAIGYSLLNILFLTKYSRTGPSSRYRSFQYLPFLGQAGMKYDVSPLFDDEYLSNLYKYGNGSKVDIIIAFLRRIWSLFKIHKYDLLVIEYEILPYFPALFERLLCLLGVRYIVDYDDALFHQYDKHHNPLIRKLLGKKIAVVMRHAELVIVGNAYLESYAVKAGAKQVEILPTVIDLDRYPSPCTTTNKDDMFVIGWIGSPTSAWNLQHITPALAEVCRDGKAKLRLIGSGPVDLPGVDYEMLDWCEDYEVGQTHSFDVGIMPLADEPWTRGKCGFKLIQYMACGLPVIASPVGVNAEIVDEHVNGFLASTQDEWKQAFETLITDAELRKTMGVCGRNKVEQHYCLQLTGPRLAGLLINAVNSDLV